MHDREHHISHVDVGEQGDRVQRRPHRIVYDREDHVSHVDVGGEGDRVQRRPHHIVYEPDAELPVVDVGGQEGRAAPVSLAPVGAEGGQPLLHEFLEHNEGALAPRSPLQSNSNFVHKHSLCTLIKSVSEFSCYEQRVATGIN